MTPSRVRIGSAQRIMEKYAKESDISPRYRITCSAFDAPKGCLR